jgi:hypothetical protein
MSEIRASNVWFSDDPADLEEIRAGWDRWDEVVRANPGVNTHWLPSVVKPPAHCWGCGERTHFYDMRYCYACREILEKVVRAEQERVRAEREQRRIEDRSNARAAARAALTCRACGEELSAERSTKAYCSLLCRVRAFRARNANGFRTARDARDTRGGR